MKIYDIDGTEYLDIAVDDSSYRYCELRGEDYVRLEFSSPTHIELPLRSYIVVDNVRYTLLQAPKIESQHSRSYAYVARFEGPQALLKLFRFRNTTDSRQKFPLTAKPIEHLQILIDNLAPRDGMWQLGECVDAPEKAISYNYLNCYDALELIAATFETEWEVVGGVISLRKVEYNRDEPLDLAYGKGKGLLPGVGRSIFGEDNPISIVCPQGSERNIDPSKYGHKTLQLPKNKSLSYDGRYFDDELLYDSSKGVEYITSVDGTSVRRFMPTTYDAEGTLDCTDIYPHRIGKVTNVIERDVAENFYDICDNTIPDTLDFEDYRIAGETMTIVFQSGMLAGKEFNIPHYAHGTVGFMESRRFEIAPQAYDGVVMPGDEFIPAVGDEYAIFGIALPDAYISDDANKSGAEWDMFRRCVKHLYESEKQAYSFTGELDPAFVKANDLYSKIRPGAYISFTNQGFQPTPALMRVTSTKSYINNPARIELSVSERAFVDTSHLRLVKSDAHASLLRDLSAAESRRELQAVKLLNSGSNAALKLQVESNTKLLTTLNETTIPKMEQQLLSFSLKLSGTDTKVTNIENRVTKIENTARVVVVTPNQ